MHMHKNTTQQYPDIPVHMQHNNLHTIRTQFAHNTNTHKHTETETHKQNNMQHTEQNIQENTETEHTIQNTHNSTQPQRTEQTQYPDTERTQNSAHNYRTYSFDYYYEFAYINNSNTIELYTISKENI